MSDVAFPASLATLPATVPRVRVLLVDDNEGFRESLATLLDTEEMTVVGQAPNGAKALAMIDRLAPDVVLMDVRMPEMDGIETTRELKARFPSLGIVALTGSEDQRAVRDMLVAGASCYVLKDSDGDEILYAVRQAFTGGGVLSPEVTPTVIEELTEALERERRRTRQLEIAQEALLERAARRHELISRLGHELRTPVTVILGMSQTLAKGTAPEEERASILDSLVERANGLARLVHRFEAAVEAGLTEWADVTQVAREVAEGHERVVIEAPEGPAMASLNRTAARRVIEELVDNALAFSGPDTPVTVVISIGSSGPEVRVVDRGSGIDARAMHRIFEPLEQAESLNTRTHQGVGLGLTLARMSANAMDGDVVLESTGPGGSTFLWMVTRPVT
ncbi:MAG: response regulator [Actinomycetota bacterium]|nr:response regulator [Actinomycetota bacterium]MDH5224329.1 response regulator [Actinomycetota bacterium]MDH5313286.1 response regulator [Actinomycetota bacterium]